MKRVGRAAEFLAWTVFFAFGALVLALRFWILPDIERHRDRIVAAVSRAVGQPVRVGGIQAAWLGLNPTLQLRDVRIYDREGREALVLPAVENQFAWSSLLRGRLKVQSLAIDGLRLQVRRDAQGVLYAAGNRLGGESRYSEWALGQDEIVLRNAEIEWHDELRGAPPLVLSALNLRLRNSGNAHSLGLTASPPAALGSSLELRALLEGDSVGDPAGWKGRVYAELGYTDLAAWRAWIDYPWDIEQGQGAVRAWLALEGARMRQATADVALAGLVARFGEGLAPLRLASMEGRLQGRLEDERYALAARGLAASIEGGPAVPSTDFELSWSSGGDARGSFAASALELHPLAHLAASLPLPQRLKELLARTKPRGRVSEARLDWSGELKAPSGFSARGRFSDLSAEPAGAIPGFAGLSGSFETTEAKGRVQLASRKSALRMPQVFPVAALAVDFLDGQVEWERQGETGFSLKLPSLSFSNEHLSGNANATYRSAPEGPGSIDLSAQFNRADAAHLGRYLPHARLMGGQATRDWVTRSIVAGRSGDVRVRLRGDLREFPFADPQRGQFSVAARVDNGVLAYAEGWPRLEGIGGELLFERDRMQVVGRRATIQGVALANVNVALSLADRAAPLLISGEAEGASADFLKFIQASPVRRMTAGVTDPMSASGRGKLRLRLELPLRDLAKSRVAGDYEFAGNALVVHGELPPIEGVTGKVSFTESTLTVDEVRGQLFEGPVTLHGGTRADGTTQIVARGEATVSATAALFEHPWRRQLSGASSYVTTINVVKGRTQVVLESTLQGVASTLPAPLGKSATEALPLRLELTPENRVLIRLGRVVAADFARRRQGDSALVQRAAVAVTPAEGPVRLPERPGTLVYGTLGALDLDKWLPYFAASEPSTQATVFDMRIGALDLYGRRMNEVALRGAADASGWSATLKAQELAGDIAYRRERVGRLIARLTHFRMPEEYAGAAAREALQPSALPSLDLAAERFTYRGREVGRVELAGQRDGDNWRIDKLTMQNPEATLSASGVWRSGSPTRSQVQFDLNALDAGEFLRRAGYPDVVKGGKAQLKGNLAWNGHPGLMDYASLTGELQLQAQNGQFLEIEPGIGKLISLMSLQSLPRRISLDFRDVFSKGFEFDRIGSAARVDSGVMAVKDFRMRGSAAQVEMSGEVDLARETQQLRVRVVPSLGDSASTVIALVNPLLAIPAAIAQKILQDPLGHIFAFDYAVTGGWTDPKVAKLGVEARSADPQGSSQ